MRKILPALVTAFCFSFLIGCTKSADSSTNNLSAEDLLALVKSNNLPAAFSPHEATDRLLIALHFSPEPETIAALIHAGASVNASSELWTAVELALLNPDPRVLNTLLENGADPNATNLSGNTALIEALGMGYEAAPVIALLEHGADVNKPSESGDLPIFVAARSNRYPPIIDELVKHGANVMARNKSGETPLHLAATFSNSPETITALLRNGAQPNVTDNAGETPLMKAIKRSLHVSLLEVLVKGGADINARSATGKTPLMYAADKNPSLQVLSYLLENGADINAQDNEGRSALMWAVIKRANPQLITLLLEKGADANLRDKQGQTPLLRFFTTQMLSEKEYINLYGTARDVKSSEDRPRRPQHLEVLLQHGADPNIPDPQGITPLMYAAQIYRNAQPLAALLEHGADVNAKDQAGRTAFQWMLNKNPDKDLSDILSKYGAKRERPPLSAPKISTQKASTGPQKIPFLLPENTKQVDKNRLLLQAILDKKPAQEVSSLLEQGANASARDKYRKTRKGRGRKSR